MNLDCIYDQHVESLVRMLALRDIETEAHTRRVANVTQVLAALMEIPPDEVSHIRRGALLHDIGKIGVPDCILHKREPLTDKERTIISMHPVVAYEFSLLKKVTGRGIRIYLLGTRHQHIQPSACTHA